MPHTKKIKIKRVWLKLCALQRFTGPFLALDRCTSSHRPCKYALIACVHVDTFTIASGKVGGRGTYLNLYRLYILYTRLIHIPQIVPLMNSSVRTVIVYLRIGSVTAITIVMMNTILTREDVTFWVSHVIGDNQ